MLFLKIKREIKTKSQKRLTSLGLSSEMCLNKLIVIFFL